MKKIYEILRQESTKGDVGIEIEVEGRKLVLPADKSVWKGERDGSLRGDFPDYSCEYVLRKPLPLAKVKPALEELKETLKDSELDFSYRTSVHVHVNVQDLTAPQLLNLVYTYALLEDVFMNYAGKSRRCNRFCLSIQDAEGTLDAIRAIIRDGVATMALREEAYIRYAAINLAAIAKYGSVEFRAMRGNLDVGILVNWVQSLMCLKRFAQNYENVFAIYNRFVEIGAEEFAKEVFQEYLPSITYKGINEDITKNFSLTIDIPFEANRMRDLRKEVKEEKAPVNPWEQPIPEHMLRALREQPAFIPARPVVRNRRPAQIVIDDMQPVNPNEVNF
jgi:hypothetical protein